LTGLTGGVGAAESTAPSIIDLSKLMKMGGLLDAIADRRVVFVGESHNSYAHHLNQLAIIRGEHARHPHLAIGLEFFQQPFQGVLDDYIAKRIDEKEFLKKSQYFERWSYDYRLYRPIFRYAREQGIPLVALNIPREITDQVSAKGLSSLTAKQRAAIPREIDRSDQGYRTWLQGIFSQHPHSKQADFEHFLDVQLLWDEGMAERAATWLREHPRDYMVVLAGVGHVLHGYGIPNRLKRRLPVTSAIVINASPGSEVDAAMGDYLIMTQDQKLPPAGKLGAFLDTAGSPPKVTGFSRNSGAEEAGIEKGDTILRIDEKPISSYADIRIALLDKQAGQHVKVEVERKTLILGTMDHSIDVVLR